MIIYLIGLLYSKGNFVGFRIFDADAKSCMDASYESVLNVIKSGKVKFGNAELAPDGKRLVGTTGDLSYLTKFDYNTKQLMEVPKDVVAKAIGDVGYVIISPMGNMKKMRLDVAVERYKDGGAELANGKVAVIEGRPTIIPMGNQAFEVERVARSRFDNSVKDLGIATISTDNNDRTVKKNVRTDVNNELAYNDIFKDINSRQKKVLEEYYVWWTVEVYRGMTHNLRLGVSTKKVQALSDLRGDTTWLFAGCWDAGYHGASTCSLGHSLRYEYYAVPEDDRYNKEARLVFGEKCSSDFFRISPEDMRKLTNTRKAMSEELASISNIVGEGEVLKDWMRYRLLIEIISKCKDNLSVIFGEHISAALINFTTYKLPLPQSLVVNAANEYRKNAFRNFKLIFSDWSKAIDYGCDIPVALEGRYRGANMQHGCKILADYIANYEIEGAYQYDPLKNAVNKRKGREFKYNKDTRDERYRIDSEFKGATLIERKYPGAVDSQKIEDYLNFVDIMRQLDDMNAFEYVNNHEDFTLCIEDELINAYGDRDKFNNLASKLEDSIVRLNEDEDANDIKELDKKRFAGWTFLIYYKIRAGLWLSSSIRIVQIKCVRGKSFYWKSSQLKEYGISAMDVFTAAVEYLYGSDGSISIMANNSREKLRQKKLEEEANKLASGYQNNDNATHQNDEKQESADMENDDRLELLRQLFDSNKGKYDESNTGIKIAKDILKRGIEYKDLSPKQQWRIEKTIDDLGGNSKGIKKEFIKLEGDFKTLVEKITSANEDLVAKMENVDSIAYKCAVSILNRGEYTEKQKKHVDAVAHLV